MVTVIIIPECFEALSIRKHEKIVECRRKRDYAQQRTQDQRFDESMSTCFLLLCPIAGVRSAVLKLTPLVCFLLICSSLAFLNVSLDCDWNDTQAKGRSPSTSWPFALTTAAMISASAVECLTQITLLNA
uniref:Transmembrane protein n=1 Tax=Steinernema glaseri TaxID=37863 RepID=A0A1I7YW73_9BILA